MKSVPPPDLPETPCSASTNELELLRKLADAYQCPLRLVFAQPLPRLMRLPLSPLHGASDEMIVEVLKSAILDAPPYILAYPEIQPRHFYDALEWALRWVQMLYHEQHDVFEELWSWGHMVFLDVDILTAVREWQELLDAGPPHGEADLQDWRNCCVQIGRWIWILGRVEDELLEVLDGDNY